MKAKRILHERFGDIGLGEADPQPVAQLGYDDTLNITLMFGGEVRIENGLSWIEPGHLDMEVIEALKPPDVATTWPHTRFLEQYDEAVHHFGSGSVRPPVPHGILEQALDLYGDHFLVEMTANPERAGHLLDLLAVTTISVKEFWDTKCFGEVRPGLSLGGCSTTMLSGKMVADLLAPRYERIATHFGDAFLCSCGVTTQHLETWARLGGLRYVRCGWGTDLEKAAQLLRHKHVKAALDVVRAATFSPAGIEQDVLHILVTLESVENLSVLLIHASAKTADENVRRIAETVFAFAEERNIPLRSSFTCMPPVRNDPQ
jgi:hypothetical protein